MAPSKQPKKTLRIDAARLIDICPAANSRLVARRITEFFEREMVETGLSVAKLGLMAQIAAASDDTLGALAARMGLEQSTLFGNFGSRSRAEGLVEIANVEGDLRRRVVWLTDAGAQRLEAAVPLWRKAVEKLDKLLSPGLVRRLAQETEALVSD